MVPLPAAAFPVIAFLLAAGLGLLGGLSGAGPRQAAAQAMPAVPVVEVEALELAPPTTKAHAMAMHGEPKEAPGFRHFSYVNPDAPKGGTLRLSARGTFDSFHPYIPKGTPGVSSSIETLMTRGLDEPFTEYGLIAESLEWPPDRSWVTFTLRPEARWHDGQPITVEDVIWSFETLTTKGHPTYRFYFSSVAGVEKVGERQVKFTFSEGENLELPLIIGGDLPILPKHYWESRDFESTTLEPPLGSGPYKVADFEAGRFVVLERVEDYWGRDLPVNRGQHNFDRIRYDYFRDATVIREAVKAGQVDIFSENSAKEWAFAYRGRAVDDGWLIKEETLDKSSGRMQSFFMNTRRAPFDDRRLREAMAYAFDFQWTNENLYFDAYIQGTSFFSPTDLASSGLPEGEELEILERFRDRLPPEVFEEPYQPPTTDGSGWPRENLLRALELLDEAGWEVRDFKLVNKETGEPLVFEMMIQQQSLQKVLLPYQRNLAKLGIDMNIRFVDTSQYINRLRGFDFDMIIFGIGQSLSPGNEQRGFWGTAAADQPGSRNVAGIKDPVIDELIELVISAPDRESLVARTKALDRALLWGHYVVPNLVAPYDRMAFWNVFGRPEAVPLYGRSTSNWWWDSQKAQGLADWRARVEPSETATARGGSGGALQLAGFALLLLIGYFVFRRAMQRPAS